MNRKILIGLCAAIAILLGIASLGAASSSAQRVWHHSAGGGDATHSSVDLN